MDRNLEQFVHDENIRRYKQKFKTATDDNERKRLLKFLEEEEAKRTAEARDPTRAEPT